MFEQEYREVFSEVTASEATYRRVVQMKNGRISTKSGCAITKMVLIAAVVAMLAVTVSASETVAGWFRNYFTLYSNGELTAEQGSYIEENTQMVHQSQTVNGYTIEVKSAITDGRVAYLVLGYSAPVDVPLTKNSIDGAELQIVEFLHDKLTITDSLGRNGIKYTGSTIYCNYDGTNTQDSMLHFELDPKAENGIIDSEMEWHIRLEGMTGRYYDKAYANALRETKYAGKKSYRLTDEEAERMHPEIRLSEGVWEFSFRFEHTDNQEIEMITKPIKTSACTRWEADGTEVYEVVTITSFKLGTLSATIESDYQYGTPQFTDGEEARVYVVMNDGSKVELRGSTGEIGTMKLLANGPIILENVDYVLLADGTKLPMPE